MSAFPPNLLDPDDLLLLYVGGELPPEDRAGVERRLADDPGLRDRLAAVRTAVGRTEAAFAAADAASPSAVAAGRAAGRAAAAVRAWQAERASAALPATPRRAKPRVAWALPSAAAAGIALLMGGVAVMRSWPTGEPRGLEVRGPGGDRPGPPQLSPEEQEERYFHIAALGTLASGGDWLDDDTQGTPPLGPNPPSGPAAQAVAAVSPADGPFFDVPLSPDPDAGPP